jgi:UDP-N-acetylmuramate--alanine ligase
VADVLDVGALRSVHVVGAGGAGMSAIATILATMGVRVTASDLKDSAPLRRLEAIGVSVHVGHQASNLGDVDAVAISTAVPANNPEVLDAHARGIRVLRRADILAAICATRRTIAVAGTHGKTTTSSMLALILVEAGMHPSFLVGGDLNEVGGGAVWDAAYIDAPFIVEADESDGTFLTLGASGVIVTSIEPDHLDYWSTFDALAAGFATFAAAAPGPRVISADEPNAAALAAGLAAHGGAITFGLSANADWQIADLELSRSGSRFRVLRAGGEAVDVTLATPGLHNVRNAVAAMAMASSLGAPIDATVRALGRYAGVARRWQFRGTVNDITLVEDYAHLPSEVSVSIDAARSGGWRRVVVVFQPHRFSRTAALWQSFADAFTGADVLVVMDVFSAGEPSRPGVTGKLIVDAVTSAHPEARVLWLPAGRDVVAYLRKELRPGDVCLMLGAGDITSLPDDVSDALSSTTPLAP